YNIGGDAERENLEVVRAILRLAGRGEDLIEFVKDRPGHDRRYAIDSSKIRRELGWRPQRSFESGLEETFAWYVAHRDWGERGRSGAYRDHYAKWYGRRHPPRSRRRPSRPILCGGRRASLGSLPTWPVRSSLRTPRRIPVSGEFRPEHRRATEPARPGPVARRHAGATRCSTSWSSRSRCSSPGAGAS